MSARLKTLQEQRGAKVKELDAIFALARKENRSLTADEATRYDNTEKDVRALETDCEREVRHIATMSQKSPLDQYSGGEQRDIAAFDFGRLLRAMSKGGNISGIEGEMVAEGEKEARAAGIDGGQVALPRVVVQKRGVTATGTTSVTGDQGGQTIQTNINGLLDAFYNALVLVPRGATVLSNLQGNFNWPRYVKPSDMSAKPENTAADGLSPTVSSVAFTPKRIPAYVDVSDQLIIQSNETITAVLQRNIQTQASVLFQKYAINGLGSSNQPLGILKVSGIGSVAGGTNGANPLWKHIVQIKSKVATADALVGSLGWLINASVESQLQTQIKNDATGTDSRYILDPDLNTNKLAGYGYSLTNSVPSNLTKGSASGTCSAIIFGNFADLILAFWGGMTMDLVRDVAGAKAGQRTLVLNMYGDSNVVRNESFSAMQDALTPNA